MAKKVVIAYVPVLHRGYIDFFSRFSRYEGKVQGIYVLGDEILDRFEPIKKDRAIRALHPITAVTAIGNLELLLQVLIADIEKLRQLDSLGTEVIMPDEDISHFVAGEFLKNSRVEFVPTFLRWDSRNAVKSAEVRPDNTIGMDEWEGRFMKEAVEISRKSWDWWRQVGAVVVKEGKILVLAFNRHVPSDYTPYFLGDPRSSFKKGVHIELSSALHAEPAVVAWSSHNGISFKGAWLYVTTFPCPPCAKLVAFSGFEKIYFKEGYSVLDGEVILRDRGVEIIRVIE